MRTSRVVVLLFRYGLKEVARGCSINWHCRLGIAFAEVPQMPFLISMARIDLPRHDDVPVDHPCGHALLEAFFDKQPCTPLLPPSLTRQTWRLPPSRTEQWVLFLATMGHLSCRSKGYLRPDQDLVSTCISVNIEHMS